MLKWKEKKPKPGINPGTQRVGVLLGGMIFRAANAEQQTTVNYLIEKIKKFLTLMG